MYKLINSLILILLLLSCGKDKTPLETEFDVTGIEFLVGDWKWKRAITSEAYTGDRKIIVKAQEVNEFCTLSFTDKGFLYITSQSGSSYMFLKRTGTISVGNNKIIHFRNEKNEDLTFSWSFTLNQLETNHQFFNFQLPQCGIGDLVISNSYEKI